MKSSSRRLRAEASDGAVDVILRVLTTRCRRRAEHQPDKRLVLVAAAAVYTSDIVQPL